MPVADLVGIEIADDLVSEGPRWVLTLELGPRRVLDVGCQHLERDFGWRHCLHSLRPSLRLPVRKFFRRRRPARKSSLRRAASASSGAELCASMPTGFDLARRFSRPTADRRLPPMPTPRPMRSPKRYATAA